MSTCAHLWHVRVGNVASSAMEMFASSLSVHMHTSHASPGLLMIGYVVLMTLFTWYVFQ